MVAGDVVVEQYVEPVGVAVLGLAEVGVPRLLGVHQPERAAGGVLLVDQMVHLAVHTAVGRAVDIGQVEVAGLLHLFVDTHLLLGV